jgi:hypothetical protein
MMAEWSGVNEGWRREAFYVTPGNKTFKWVYAKNGSTNGGSDSGWLDNIILPPAMCLTLWAGPDIAICQEDQHQIQESYATGYTSVEWTTSGTGTFADNTQIQPVYFPSDEDIANQSVTTMI